MLRSVLLYLSEQSWLRRWLENSSASRRLTSRFVAGRTLIHGIGVLRNLADEQILGTLDCLGEKVSSSTDAAASRDAYLAALDQIQAAHLTATVSVKLTQLGLNLSPEMCQSYLLTLVERAARMKSRVEIDMESSAYTERTLQIVTDMHHSFPGGVRAVIQAYLYRSELDIQNLSRLGVPIRLCKGAYAEPASVAYESKEAVDANYVKLMKLLLSEGRTPAIATHDEKILRQAVRHTREQKIAPERFEFQMLYGIRRDLQRELVSQGFRLRLYVPYGDAWYPYFMRRLAERPANLFFLAKNLIRR